MINKINIKYLFIDDGSTDNTNKKLKNFKTQNKNLNIKIFTHESNAGYGRTLQNSIKLCDTDYLITFDSDCSKMKSKIKFFSLKFFYIRLFCNIKLNINWSNFICISS